MIAIGFIVWILLVTIVLMFLSGAKMPDNREYLP